MRASALEFRLRLVIMVALLAVGFWAPWIEAWGIGRRISLLEWTALELSRFGLLRFTDATPVVIVFASLLAAGAVVFRVWGTAYLGTAVVHHAGMKSGTLMADGPYRYARNPLYLGLWFLFAAMAFVMPPTGAAFAMVLLTIFLWRLILAEEAFLSAQLGEPYRAYLRAVPRLAPRLRTSLASGSAKPHWGRAVLAELNSIGVFVTLAFLSWRYDHLLMIKAILVSFGLSLVSRALLPADRETEITA